MKKGYFERLGRYCEVSSHLKEVVLQIYINCSIEVFNYVENANRTSISS